MVASKYKDRDTKNVLQVKKRRNKYFTLQWHPHTLLHVKRQQRSHSTATMLCLGVAAVFLSSAFHLGSSNQSDFFLVQTLK